MRGPARATALFFALAVLGADCEGDDDDLRRDLAEARERWREQGLTDYRLTLIHDCFCGAETRGPVAVLVRFGEVVSRTYVEGGGTVPADRARFFPDVEGLFDFVEDAIEEGAASIRAEFDPALGYPRLVFVDFAASVADEERGYHVLGLEPLRAGSGP